MNADVLAAIAAATQHIKNEVLALEMSHDATIVLGENDLGIGARLQKAN